MKYNVIIVGGGVSGLSCALTLASGRNHFDFAISQKYLVIDNGSSDLNKACLYNVPGIKQGSLGKEVLAEIKRQIEFYNNVDFITDRVIKIEGEKGNFSVLCESKNVYNGEFIVVATGFHEFNIEIKDIEVLPHNRSPRPGKVMIKVDEKLRVKEGLYVAGTLAGKPTMFSCAAGSGVEIACDIQSYYAGKEVVVHDVPSNK